MMRYDTTLKQLFQTLPQRLLQLLVGQEATELVPVEFPSVKKRVPDLVVRLRDDSILHMELQIIEEEVNEMAISIDVMENSFLRNLFMKGEQRGEERGERNATEKIFVRLLVQRFGNISSEVHKKVAMADKDTLERWTDLVMDANSIDHLLNN
ncbi:MAG: hypothetical protein H7839_16655 [Magnetococcus sp. YQC-5]